MLELKDLITLVSVLFAIVSGIFAYLKWKPQKRSIEADVVSKVIANLEKMTDLYDKSNQCCQEVTIENTNLKRKYKVT